MAGKAGQANAWRESRRDAAGESVASHLVTIALGGPRGGFAGFAEITADNARELAGRLVELADEIDRERAELVELIAQRNPNVIRRGE